MAGARLRPRPARPARPSYLQLPVQTIPEPAGRDDDQADRCRQAAVHVLGHSPTPQPRLPSPAYRPGRRPGPAWRPGGVGDRRGVAGANLHGPGADAVGHEPQQVWVDHPVTGGDQDHDGNLRHASGPAGSAKAARDRLFHRGHDPRLLQGNVLDEVGRKRRRVEPHKAQRVDLEMRRAGRRREPGVELTEGLALVGRERRGEHQADHVGDAGSRIRDDRAPVGVAGHPSAAAGTAPHRRKGRSAGDSPGREPPRQAWRHGNGDGAPDSATRRLRVQHCSPGS